MLLKMLKKSAADEVDSGLKKPEGEGDMHGLQTERVLDIDHDMDHPTPEHDVETKELSRGGVVEDVNAEAPGEIPMESTDGHPDKEGSAHEEATESEEERIAEGDIEPMHSPFETFLKKKRK